MKIKLGNMKRKLENLKASLKNVRLENIEVFLEANKAKQLQLPWLGFCNNQIENGKKIKH